MGLADNLIPVTNESLDLSQMYFNMHPFDYVPSHCFDNCVTLLFHLIHEKKIDANRLETVYGVICSGDAFDDGIFVYHGWMVLDKKHIIDVTLPTTYYSRESALTYKYIPWKTFDVKKYVDSIEKTTLPDVLMERDEDFKKSLTELGYKLYEN